MGNYWNYYLLDLQETFFWRFNVERILLHYNILLFGLLCFKYMSFFLFIKLF